VGRASDCTCNQVGRGWTISHVSIKGGRRIEQVIILALHGSKVGSHMMCCGSSGVGLLSAILSFFRLWIPLQQGQCMRSVRLPVHIEHQPEQKFRQHFGEMAEVLSKAAEDSLFNCSEVSCTFNAIGRIIKVSWRGSKGGKWH